MYKQHFDRQQIYPKWQVAFVVETESYKQGFVNSLVYKCLVNRRLWRIIEPLMPTFRLTQTNVDNYEEKGLYEDEWR